VQNTEWRQCVGKQSRRRAKTDDIDRQADSLRPATDNSILVQQLQLQQRRRQFHLSASRTHTHTHTHRRTRGRSPVAITRLVFFHALSISNKSSNAASVPSLDLHQSNERGLISVVGIESESDDRSHSGRLPDCATIQCCVSDFLPRYCNAC